MNKKIIKTMIVLGMLIPTIKPQAFVLDKVTCTETNAHKEWRELPKELKKKVFEPIMCQEAINASKRNKSHINGTLPASHDSRNVNGNSYVTSVKHQVYENGEDSNLCWAFSTVSAVETAYSLENNLDNSERDQIDLSEEQLGQVVTYRYANGEINPDGFFEQAKDGGGNLYTHAAQSVAARKAFVTETTVRFGATLESAHANAAPEYIAKESYVKILEEEGTCTADSIRAIKEAVVRYGSVSISTSTMAQALFGPEVESVYNDVENFDLIVNLMKNSGQYTAQQLLELEGLKNLTHAITIIGYDDNYNRNNFAPPSNLSEIPGYQLPQNNGAFIVKDSYTDSGNNGYYYLSYEDDLMCRGLFVTYSNIEEIENPGIRNSYNDPSTGLPADGLFNFNGRKTKVIFKKNIELKSTEVITELSVYATAEGDEIAVLYSPSATGTLDEAVELATLNATKQGWSTINVTQEAINELGNVSGTGTVFLEYTSESIPSGVSSESTFIVPKEGDLGYASLDGTNWESTFTIGREQVRIYPLINVFTETNNGGPSFEVKTTTESADFSVEKGGTLTIELNTQNMSASDINVQIVNDSNQDITNKFEVVKGSNKIEIKLTSESPAGNIIVKLSHDGRERTVRASVPATSNVKVTKITLTGTEEMALGGELHLTAKIEPENATNQTLSWRSSDDTIATVENGIVKGLKEGRVVITATAQDGSNVSASHAIKVVTVAANGDPTPTPDVPNKGNDSDENPNTGVKDTILPLSILGLCGAAFYLHTNKNNIFKRSL